MTTLTKKATGINADAVNVSLESALPITVGGGPGTDAFGRLRVSEADTIFESQHQYDKNPLFWVEKTVGASSSAHVPDGSLVRLTVGGDADDSIIRQTRQYWRYQPGKSQQIYLTFGAGTLTSGLRFRCGYFDADNGIYIEQFGTTTRMVLRSKVSGSVVDSEFTRADWSFDKFDGSGPSGIKLDMTKSQILDIDLQWLSVGLVRVGFVIGGLIHIAHEFKNANVIDGPYMSTANLPVRYELVNTTGDSSDSVDMICCSVSFEGGFFSTGLPFSADSGDDLVSVSSRLALVSIRPKATFNSIVNRGMIIPLDLSLLANIQSARFELIYDGTLGGTPVWNSVDDNSITEFDVAGTTVTGGLRLKTIYVDRNRDREAFPGFVAKTPLALDIDGADPKSLTVVATTITGATANVAAAIQLGEIR